MFTDHKVLDIDGLDEDLLGHFTNGQEEPYGYLYGYQVHNSFPKESVKLESTIMDL